MSRAGIIFLSISYARLSTNPVAIYRLSRRTAMPGKDNSYVTHVFDADMKLRWREDDFALLLGSVDPVQSRLF